MDAFATISLSFGRLAQHAAASLARTDRCPMNLYISHGQMGYLDTFQRVPITADLKHPKVEEAAMSEERAVQQVLAKYVRGTDKRDGAAVAALFVETGRVKISYNKLGHPESVGELVGRDAIATAVSQMMKPHPAYGWSHHTTHDHIIEVDGEIATIDAQFVVFEVRGKQRPVTGWPEDAFGVQGTVTPIEAGYYRPTLRRLDGVWKIETLQIIMSLPLALPGH